MKAISIPEKKAEKTKAAIMIMICENSNLFYFLQKYEFKL